MNIRADAIQADDISTYVVAGNLVLPISCEQDSLTRTGTYRVERIEPVPESIKRIAFPKPNSFGQKASNIRSRIRIEPSAQARDPPLRSRALRCAAGDFALNRETPELRIGVREDLYLFLCRHRLLLTRCERSLECLYLREGVLHSQGCGVGSDAWRVAA